MSFLYDVYHTGYAAIENVNTIDNVDKKSIETQFSIAICYPTGDKWQLKTLFLASFDLCSSTVRSVFDSRLSRVCTEQ